MEELIRRKTCEATPLSDYRIHLIPCVNETNQIETFPGYRRHTRNIRLDSSWVYRRRWRIDTNADPHSPSCRFRTSSPGHMKLRDKVLRHILGLRHLNVARLGDIIGAYWQSATLTFLCKQNLTPNVQAITWRLIPT